MDTLGELVHAQYRYHGPAGVTAAGRDGAEQLISGFRAAFSDLHAEVTSVIAQDDRVAMTLTMTGTHDGAGMGVDPTGRKIEMPVVLVSRFEGGLIIEEWEYYDAAKLRSDFAPGPGSDLMTTLVIGGRGKTGRRVCERLATAGLPVRAASRSGETRFDWEDETTWAPALDGVDAVYLTYYPDLAFPGAAETVGAFADRAVAMGVERIVLLSGRGEEGARHSEERVKNSGADWTIVRCAFFNQNFSETFAEPVRHGVLSMPGGETQEPFLDAEDIADVVFAALTDPRHIGKLYELTGPRLLTLSQAAAEISAAIGREVQYLPTTSQDYAAELVQSGMPAEEAVPISELIAAVLDGRNSYLSDGVQQALGRPPRDFADYARAAAAGGAWDLTKL